MKNMKNIKLLIILAIFSCKSNFEKGLKLPKDSSNTLAKNQEKITKDNVEVDKRGSIPVQTSGQLEKVKDSITEEDIKTEIQPVDLATQLQAGKAKLKHTQTGTAKPNGFGKEMLSEALTSLNSVPKSPTGDPVKTPTEAKIPPFVGQVPFLGATDLNRLAAPGAFGSMLGPIVPEAGPIGTPPVAPEAGPIGTPPVAPEAALKETSPKIPPIKAAVWTGSMLGQIVDRRGTMEGRDDEDAADEKEDWE